MVTCAQVILKSRGERSFDFFNFTCSQNNFIKVTIAFISSSLTFMRLSPIHVGIKLQKHSASAWLIVLIVLQLNARDWSKRNFIECDFQTFPRSRIFVVRGERQWGVRCACTGCQSRTERWDETSSRAFAPPGGFYGVLSSWTLEASERERWWGK